MHMRSLQPIGEDAAVSVQSVTVVAADYTVSRFSRGGRGCRRIYRERYAADTPCCSGCFHALSCRNNQSPTVRAIHYPRLGIIRRSFLRHLASSLLHLSNLVKILHCGGYDDETVRVHDGVQSTKNDSGTCGIRQPIRPPGRRVIHFLIHNRTITTHDDLSQLHSPQPRRRQEHQGITSQREICKRQLRASIFIRLEKLTVEHANNLSSRISDHSAFILACGSSA